MGPHPRDPGRQGGGDVHVEPRRGAEGVFQISLDGERRLATKNLTPGRSIYGEKLLSYDGEEYRVWDPYRSKLAAYLLRSRRGSPLKPGEKVLYLGAGSGTTASHVSDILGPKGKLYCIEFASRAMRELITRLCPHRRNLYPILADARFPKRYLGLIGRVDGVYCDIAQPDQARILIDNSQVYLKKGGWALIALKARSIDVSKSPRDLFKREVKTMEKEFTIKATVTLDPYERDHAMVESSYSP